MASNAVVLRGTPHIDETASAAEAITPGHLIEHNGSGAFIKHATAAKNAQPIFALEREELGDEMSDAYASGDFVKAAFCASGDKINALIASGQNISIGDALESAGNGTVRALATDAATDDTQRDSVVGYAAAGSGGAVTADTRLPMWIA